MKLISGYNNAKHLLDRRKAGVNCQVNTALKIRLKTMFGVETPEEAVSLIISQVRQRGDEGLQELSLLIDGIKPVSLKASNTDIKQAYDDLNQDVKVALELAAGQIRQFHDAQRKAIPERIEVNDCCQISRPLERVGVYAPGGTACYPSSVLMTAIPARCAGVNQVVLATPPGKDGKIPGLMLAAAAVAGVDEVYVAGGAQAIAALAYGTNTIRAVDKICGPGNIFVMLAKKQVFGAVDIDGLQGPSEVMIIAGDSSSQDNTVNEILAQAEHDMMAQSILVTTSASFAEQVNCRLENAVSQLSRSQITGSSLEAAGLIAVVDSFEEAVQLADMYAPEHLVVDLPDQVVDYTVFKNAGCIFAGCQPTVVMGDYVSGPSHALPTGGSARFSSPLNVADFIRYYNVVNVTRSALEKLGPAASVLARAEGLTAHARAVECRLSKQEI